MTTRPGYVWDNTASEWVEIGQAAVLAPVKYQATAPTSPATGDIWIDSDDEVPGITSSLNYRWRRIATGGETSLSGNDTSGLPLAYNPGYEQVYLNGVLLYRGSDYVATTGNTITGLTALVANDTIEVLSFVTAPIGDTYTQAAADGKFVNVVNNGMFLVKPTSVTGGTINANGVITVGSAVSSVTINGAFSAAYDNYKIIVTGGTSTNQTNLTLKLGASSNTYYGSYIYGSIASTTVTSANVNNAANFGFAGACDIGLVSANIELTSPFVAKTTSIFAGMVNYGNNRGTFAGDHETNASYSDFTLAPGTGTITGCTIRIYGYNNGA
jgi:hypothetical protein